MLNPGIARGIGSREHGLRSAGKRGRGKWGEQINHPSKQMGMLPSAMCHNLESSRCTRKRDEGQVKTRQSPDPFLAVLTLSKDRRVQWTFRLYIRSLPSRRNRSALPGVRNVTCTHLVHGVSFPAAVAASRPIKRQARLHGGNNGDGSIRSVANHKQTRTNLDVTPYYSILSSNCSNCWEIERSRRRF